MSSHLPRRSPGGGISVVVFDPHPPSCVVSQSKCVIRVPRHVLNVPVQAHVGIEEHGDRGPGAVPEIALETPTTPVPEERCISLIPPDCASSPRTFVGPSVAFRHASSMLYLNVAGPAGRGSVILSFCHLSWCPVFRKHDRTSPHCHGAQLSENRANCAPKGSMSERSRSVMAPSVSKKHGNDTQIRRPVDDRTTE